MNGKHTMRVVIIEDETAAAAVLASLLRENFPYMCTVAQLESVAETVEWFSSGGEADLAFMDIHLADGSAFSIFDRTEINCPIIFTTAYDRYALEAFRVNSIDYLLKPVKAADLLRAVEKLENLAGNAVKDYMGRVEYMVQSQRGAQAFLIYVKDRIVPLRISEIAYLYSSNEKVSLGTLKGEVYPFDKTLEASLSLLPENDFFRANRQFVISREAIEDVAVWFGSKLSVNLSVEAPERVVISKARVPEFKRWLAGIR